MPRGPNNKVNATHYQDPAVRVIEPNFAGRIEQDFSCVRAPGDERVALVFKASDASHTRVAFDLETVTRFRMTVVHESTFEDDKVYLSVVIEGFPRRAEATARQLEHDLRADSALALPLLHLIKMCRHGGPFGVQLHGPVDWTNPGRAPLAHRMEILSGTRLTNGEVCAFAPDWESGQPRLTLSTMRVSLQGFTNAAGSRALYFSSLTVPDPRKQFTTFDNASFYRQVFVDALGIEEYEQQLEAIKSLSGFLKSGYIARRPIRRLGDDGLGVAHVEIRVDHSLAQENLPSLGLGKEVLVQWGHGANFVNRGIVTALKPSQRTINVRLTFRAHETPTYHDGTFCTIVASSHNPKDELTKVINSATEAAVWAHHQTTLQRARYELPMHNLLTGQRRLLVEVTMRTDVICPDHLETILQPLDERQRTVALNFLLLDRDRGGVAALQAPGGAGKTFVLIALARAHLAEPDQYRSNTVEAEPSPAQSDALARYGQMDPPQTAPAKSSAAPARYGQMPPQTAPARSSAAPAAASCETRYGQTIFKNRVLGMVAENQSADDWACRLAAADPKLVVVRLASKSRDGYFNRVPRSIGPAWAYYFSTQCRKLLARLSRDDQDRDIEDDWKWFETQTDNIDWLGEGSRDEHEYPDDCARRVEQFKARLEAMVINRADVVIVTDGNISDQRFLQTRFTCLLVDEVYRMVEPTVIAAMSKKGLRICMLAGDEHQLGPQTAARDKAAQLQLTIVGRLRQSGYLVPYQLNWQFRMHSSIWRLVKTRVYADEVDTGPDVDTCEDSVRVGRILDRAFPGRGLMDQRACWVTTGGVEQPLGTSYVNEESASTCDQVIQRLVAAGAERRSITLLTPYLAQEETRRTDSGAGVTVTDREHATIDGFQGRENEIVVLDLVRHNERNGTSRLGFLADARRAASALTRPRYALIVVGSPRFWELEHHHTATVMEEVTVELADYRFELDDE